MFSVSLYWPSAQCWKKWCSEERFHFSSCVPIIVSRSSFIFLQERAALEAVPCAVKFWVCGPHYLIPAPSLQLNFESPFYI